jgi:hypothetical protein
MNRRAFLSGLAGASLPLLIGRRAWAQAASPSRPPPLIGAIRWDAWYDPADEKVAQSVERSLGPAEFHYRMPFFGRETGPNSVRINGDSQAVMDQEIAAAAGAGLAYWAFCTYAEDDPLSNALKLYLASALRNQIGFCAICGLASKIPYFAVSTEYHIKLMLEPGYTKVLGDRPLFYVLSSTDQRIKVLGGAQKIADWVRYIRSEVQRRGGDNPYFVLSEGNPTRVAKLCHDLDFDAVGLYATAVGPFGGAPYEVLVKETESYWDKLAATGVPLVPNIMSGWDSRPRFKHPFSVDKPKPTDPPPVEHYYQDGTPREIARHIADAIAWIKTHPAQAPANTALIYAWDECDEGFGALLPTYDPAHPQGNYARLKAIAEVLKDR